MLHLLTSLSRRRFLGTATTLAGAMVALRIPTAQASLVMAMELPELTAQSDAIVVGKVLSSTSRFEEDRKAILSDIYIQVQESWKGQLLGKSRTIKVVQPGGTVGDLEMHVHGLPAFSAGESALLFLTARDKAHATLGFILTGLGQGKRRLFLDTQGQLMASPSDRSAAVHKTPTGVFQAAPADQVMKLSDLRQQVRLLLGTSK